MTGREEVTKKSLAGDGKSEHGSRRRKQRPIIETAVEDQPWKLRGDHSGGLTVNRHRPDRVEHVCKHLRGRGRKVNSSR